MRITSDFAFEHEQNIITNFTDESMDKKCE